MKVSKIFGFVLCLHAGVGAVLIVMPGCRTAQPPTQTYKQDGRSTAISSSSAVKKTAPSTFRNGVKGASRSDSSLIEATRIDQGSTLDAAFNAGIEGDTFSNNQDFGEFDDIPAVEPIAPMVSDGPVVDIAGSGFKTYTVVKGDSLWAIAKRHSVSLNEVYAANGLSKNSVLKIGQQIQIPSEGGTAVVSTVTADTYQPSSHTSGSKSYTVKGGDNLSKIASQHGTTVRAIKAANGKTSDMIRIGEKLIIPVDGGTGFSTSSTTVAPVSTTSVTTVAPVASGGSGTHTVRSGEYPASIASKYGMTSGELLALNGITDPRKLQIGQVLKVDGSGSAANMDTKTETVTSTTTLIPATFGTTSAPVASEGPVAIRVIEADPLVEDEAAIIDVDSEFEGVIEIPVIRLEE
ncbi:MAG: LysM peptidoglycan-binding domain-containing protein [Opitutaceae bacterium]